MLERADALLQLETQREKRCLAAARERETREVIVTIFSKLKSWSWDELNRGTKMNFFDQVTQRKIGSGREQSSQERGESRSNSGVERATRVRKRTRFPLVLGGKQMREMGAVYVGPRIRVLGKG